MSMTPEQIFAELRKLAPHVVFSTDRFEDPMPWEGDGPSPEEDGMVCYTVDVKAAAVVDGEMFEGEASLGDSWEYPSEPIGDMHGYLPQKLEEAADDLQGQVSIDAIVWGELGDVLGFLKKEMKARYDEQMAGR